MEEAKVQIKTEVAVIKVKVADQNILNHINQNREKLLAGRMILIVNEGVAPTPQLPHHRHRMIRIAAEAQIQVLAGNIQDPNPDHPDVHTPKAKNIDTSTKKVRNAKMLKRRKNLSVKAKEEKNMIAMKNQKRTSLIPRLRLKVTKTLAEVLFPGRRLKCTSTKHEMMK